MRAYSTCRKTLVTRDGQKQFEFLPTIVMSTLCGDEIGVGGTTNCWNHSEKNAGYVLTSQDMCDVCVCVRALHRIAEWQTRHDHEQAEKGRCC